MRGTRRVRWLPPVLVVSLFLLLAGCGGGDDEIATPPPVAPADPSGGVAQGGATGSAPAAGGSAPGGSTVESNTGAEALRDAPFVLNDSQPVPPEFREAYGRRALIVVEFYQEQQQNPLYPQGLEVDDFVRNDLGSLRAAYPQVEFFTYEITNPGPAGAEDPDDLERGQYGTLAAQLRVGFTPFVAMLSPQLGSEGDAYVVENLYQGYVEAGVLDQALFDLTDTPDEGNTSDLDVVLDGIELTESGGGVEYFTVTNRTRQIVSLQGFSLRLVDPETAQIVAESGSVQVNDRIQVQPEGTVSVGRVPDLRDRDGRRMSGVFETEGDLALTPTDQVALLDSGGAVADTIPVQETVPVQ